MFTYVTVGSKVKKILKTSELVIETRYTPQINHTNHIKPHYSTFPSPFGIQLLIKVKKTRVNGQMPFLILNQPPHILNNSAYQGGGGFSFSTNVAIIRERVDTHHATILILLMMIDSINLVTGWMRQSTGQSSLVSEIHNLKLFITSHYRPCRFMLVSSKRTTILKTIIFNQLYSITITNDKPQHSFPIG